MANDKLINKYVYFFSVRFSNFYILGAPHIYFLHVINDKNKSTSSPALHVM